MYSVIYRFSGVLNRWYRVIELKKWLPMFIYCYITATNQIPHTGPTTTTTTTISWGKKHQYIWTPADINKSKRSKNHTPANLRCPETRNWCPNRWRLRWCLLSPGEISIVHITHKKKTHEHYFFVGYQSTITFLTPNTRAPSNGVNNDIPYLDGGRLV